MLDPVELFPEVPNLYDFPSVHSDMLLDRRRISAYQQAISEVVQLGDTVVDLGAGTGILSFLCIQAGAKKVHAIERASIINSAKIIAFDNGFADQIVFHHGDSRSISLPEKVDVIVSEIIGHVAFEEGMTAALLDARNRFLKKDGQILPSFVDLRGALVNETHVYHNYISSWDTFFGFDFSALQEIAAKTAYVTEIYSKDLMSDSTRLLEWNFTELNFERDREIEFDLPVLRDGQVNGLALWFEATLSPSVFLSSSPWNKTHWGQCFLPFLKPIEVRARETMKMELRMAIESPVSGTFEISVAPHRENRDCA